MLKQLANSEFEKNSANEFKKEAESMVEILRENFEIQIQQLEDNCQNLQQEILRQNQKKYFQDERIRLLTNENEKLKKQVSFKIF